ncbi:MAG: tetratricopeptide repeat protein [Proteobacteria bacterium]|nr:tetratricopeptide repeat protein [Pseudomonadota bacterium]
MMNISPDINKKYNLLFIFIILIAGAIAYSNSFDCSFHFDDERVLDSSIKTYSTSINEVIRINPTRPIGMLTFAINYNIHRFDVRGYHLVNLIIHLINALLVWQLTSITFSTPVMKDAPISRNKTIIAFLTGLLFVTHPLATQSVTYISQRFTSLATLFYFLSLILFIRGRLRQGNKGIALFLFGSSLLSAVCGILTKEIVFTLPFAVILYDYCFFKTFPWKLEANDKILFFSFIILVIFIFFLFRHFSLKIFDIVPPDHGYSYAISMKEYFLTQFRVILTYIRLFLLPVNQNLDYNYPVSAGFFQLKTFFSFLVLLGILSAGVLLFKRYRLISFGIFWFFLTLSVESSIIPISQDVIFEHRTYLSGFGFFLVLTGVSFYFIREKHLGIVLILILMIAVQYTALTYQRNKIWKDDYTLWGDCIKKSPDKARVNHSFGIALSHIKGNAREAIYYHNKSISLSKNYAEPYDGRGFAYYMLGQYQRAVEDYNEAIRLKPHMAELYNNRSFSYLALGQYQRAVEDYNKAIRLKPHMVEPYNNRGFVYYILGQYQRAIEDYNKAISLRPDYADYYNNRGNTYAEIGQYQHAFEDFNKAIHLRPDYAGAYYDNRGMTYFKQGNKELGCRDARKACELGNCKALEVAKGKGDCQ